MKPIQSQIALTSCLILLLLWMSNLGYSQDFPNVIIKSKLLKKKHINYGNSTYIGNTFDFSDLTQDSSDSKQNPHKDRLKFEILTNGQWVPLNLSGSTIVTTNQPLKISYESLKHPVKPVVIKLKFEKYLDRLLINEIPAKLEQNKVSKYSQKLNDLSSVVIPRPTAGVYSIAINELNGETYPPFWLKVSALPPEPPILYSIDERQAEVGNLTLKFKNVVIGDKITFFINNGQDGKKSHKIEKESQLDSFILFESVLYPGKSTITAQLERGGKKSGYSNPVEAESRKTVLLTRTVNFVRDEFIDETASTKNSSQKKLEDKFSFGTKANSDLQMTAKTTTDKDVAKLEAEIGKMKKCLQFQNSGWDKAPIFVWPSEVALKASHISEIKDLQKLPTPILDKEETIIFSKEESEKIVDGFNNSQGFTLDITFKAIKDVPHKQLRRIISLSNGTGERNFTLGQYGKDLVFRFRDNNSINGLSVVHGGAQGIHFYKKLVAGQIYNVVISYQNQKLRFWVDQNEISIPEAQYSPKTISWKDNGRLILGNELGQPSGDTDRLWKGKINSFSIRNAGVTLHKPDAECLDYITTQTTAVTSASNTGSAAQASANQNTTSKPSQSTTSDSDNKISIKEFAFPYPASFPISRYSQSGNTIETEGAVLDQMHLAIANDGRFKLNFDARTSVRAEINLQLMVKLKNQGWFPITLPKQTIIPAKNKNANFGSSSVNGAKPHSITLNGYSALFVNRRNQITDIRRRGNAVFGTRPY